MVYDAERAVTVLYGGFNGTVLGDTWEWDGSVWLQRCSACTPGPRHTHAMAYDDARGVTVVYGGMYTSAPGVTALNDSWQWDGDAWVELCDDCVAGPRNYVRMAGLAATGVMIFGGNTGSATCNLQDSAWINSGGDWRLVAASGDVPLRRNTFAMTYDPDRQVVIMFGGGGGEGCNISLQSDTWELALACELDVPVDIKPGSCPNAVNLGSGGWIPVSILGTDQLDVSTIDISTVRLSRAAGGGTVAPWEDPPGPHSVYEDTGTPLTGGLCDCHDLDGDGLDDLSMKFKTQEVVTSLDLQEFGPGAVIEVIVTATLLDQTSIIGRDCLVVTGGN